MANRMINTTPPKQDKPMVIRWRDLLGAGGPIRPASRCGPWGGKGRKGRGEKNRKAIVEES